MDTPFSKSRKRQRTSSEEAMSFMRNVTSRMSGLLPATITNWFSNNNSNANGSTAKVDARDSSTDDEAPESPSQVPVKRKRFTSPNICNNVTSTEMNSDNSDHFAVTEFKPDKDMLRRDTIFVSTSKKINEDEIFDRKEKETDRLIFKSQHTVSAIGKSVAAKRQSLFDTYNKNIETITASGKSSLNEDCHIKQPYFKPVLLGSPFYPGMTMYGGAGSCYMNTANIKQEKVEVVKNEGKNDTSAMSMSTRRVMDLLEHYSSPLTEAKRIPQYTKPSVHEKANDSGVNISSGKNNKYQELCIPRYLGVIKIRPKSRLTNMTYTARQLLASHSSLDTKPYPTNSYKQGDDTESMASGKLITKMKKKITRTQRGDATDIEETVVPVEFKSSSLKIDDDKLPTFSLQNNPFPGPITSTPKPSSTMSSSLNTGTTTKTMLPTKNDIAPENVPNNIFTFANPIKINCETTENSSIPAQYTFGSPDKQVNIKEEKIIEAPLEDKIKCTENIKGEWKCPDCWVKNKPDAEKCVCCGGKPENKPPKCMHNKCVDTLSKNTKITSSLTVPCIETPKNTHNQLQKVSQWKCDDCWVGNDNAAYKCICCGASKPKNSSPTIQNTNVFLEKDRKCDYCGLSNKSVSDKCGACSNSKLGSGNTASTLKTSLTVPHKPTSSSSFQEITKAQKSDSWECRICLVTNFINSSRCQCCDSQKELKGPKVNLKFGMNTDFKFGNALKEEEASIDKKNAVHEDHMYKEKPREQKSEANNNNNLAETPSFKFLLPVKKSEEKLESATTKAEESKPCFKFGISHQIKVEPVSSEILKRGKFTELSKPVEIDEKPQEVPSVNLLNSKIISNSMTENASVTSPNNVALGSMFKNTNDTEKKETLSSHQSNNLPILQQNLLPSTDTLKPQHSFAFPTEVKPSLNFFTTVPSTTTATIVFGSPKETNSATVTAPTLLFQNTVTTAATSSMFTFGTKTTQNNAIPEKPQFLFKFGNNKNDLSLTFKPFGSITDNGANKFGITTGSTAAASNTVQTANATDSSNGLSSTNMLTGGQNVVLSSGGGSGLPTNTALVGNGCISGTTLGGNGFSSNSVSGGNSLNTGLTISGTGMNTTVSGTGMNTTISGTGLNTGNPMGRNTLNVGNNLGSTTLNSGNALPGNRLNVDNALGGRLTTTGSIIGGNTMSGVGPIGGNGSNNNIFANPSPNQAYSLQNTTTATPVFGQTVQKENMWSLSNPANSNLIMPNTTSKEPASFTFNSTAPFNASNSTSAFANNTQPSTNVFGLNQNQSTQNTGTMFSMTPRNLSAPSIFGSPSAASNNQTSAPNIFGTPNLGTAPTFGASNPSIPSFEAPSLTPAQAPAFNFGTPQSTGIFGFGQQQQPAGQGTNVYNFSATSNASQMNFNMGVGGSGVPGRRIKRAARRTTQR